MENWKSTDGYLIFDFSEVNPALTTQTVPGIYARAKNLIANNKFVLLVNEGAHTPIPSVVAFVNNAYVIETVLYAYTILPNDSVRKTNHEYGAATLEDMTDVSILNPVTGDVLRYDSETNYWINGKVKSSELNNDAGFITAADVPTIDDSTVSDHRVWSSEKVNNELLTKADTSAVPTKTSQLTNDSGFITSSAVPTKTSQLTNDSGFITAADVPVIDDTAVVNNKVWSSYKTNSELLGKQNILTAGTNISISGDTISATDTTYTEGTGIDITSGQISLDIDSMTDTTGVTLDSTFVLPVSDHNGTEYKATVGEVVALANSTTVESASWFATTSSATNVDCTNSINITKGIWLVIISTPIMSVNPFAFQLAGSNINKYSTLYPNIAEQNNCIILIEATANTSIKVTTGQSTSQTFSYIERGGLYAYKLA